MCPGETSVEILDKLHANMSETGHELDSFPHRFSFARLVNDITNWERCKMNVQLERVKGQILPRDDECTHHQQESGV